MRIRTPLPSNFETLLTEFFKGADDTGEAPRPSHRFSISSLEAAWGVAAQARALPMQEGSNRDTRRIAYGDESDGGHGVSLDPHKILSELGLHSEATEAEIAMLRREFALRNHPDRVPADLRDAATQRMMIANDLMDRHLAKLRRSAG
ncbi:heat shock protein DnaJ domain-containing protein [Hyphomicrobium denitrificans 1NES1]|uniref:Heat shock protein DnaJ domain-containing protein n=1 Tax=Hyphomicrobium denitrificans 1NES1 TaxID=670307 RepID=N0BGX0_9HYPH|nr:J domain-containing protein [Hyphomicrobium denitrificans]AGK59390.1 heat shock protein DnaJ domain-containing protein [Hyphomicrobium denitrificans 1NES1]